MIHWIFHFLMIFQVHSVFPDSKKWTDNYVFINNTYSDRQITAGIATFDALDNIGRIVFSDATFNRIFRLIILHHNL